MRGAGCCVPSAECRVLGALLVALLVGLRSDDAKAPGWRRRLRAPAANCTRVRFEEFELDIAADTLLHSIDQRVQCFAQRREPGPSFDYSGVLAADTAQEAGGLLPPDQLLQFS